MFSVSFIVPANSGTATGAFGGALHFCQDGARNFPEIDEKIGVGRG